MFDVHITARQPNRTSHRQTARGSEVDMIKVYCDKCGKEVGEFEAYTILVEAPEIKSWADQYMYERRGYQVCRDCMAEIATFIEPRTTE